MRTSGDSGLPSLLLALATGLLALQGCAHVYVDGEGRRNVIGFVWLTLPAPEDRRGDAAESIQSRSVGLSLTRSEAGMAAVIGYSDSTLAFVRDDRAVAVHALLPRNTCRPDKDNEEETHVRNVSERLAAAP